MPEAEARIATTDASRYLTDVALAFVHTYPVRYDAITGEVELPGGELVMTADGDSLSLRLIGPEGQAFEEAKTKVADLVDRAAGRESGVRCVWHELS